MKPQVAFALTALLLSGAPAFALDFGHGFTLTGDVELEYDSTSYFNDTIGFADLTMGWRSETGSLGFDLTSVNVNDFESNDSLSALWGGLVLSTAYGDLTVGSPRPLIDTLSPAPNVGLLRLYDLELGLFTGSYLAAMKLQASGVNSYGATFAGTSGALSYGIGLHRAEQGGNGVSDLEIVGGYDAGTTHIYGGMERLSDSGFDFTRLMLGAHYSADRWSVGAEASHTDFFLGTVNFYSLYGDYEVIDGLKIGAQYWALDEGSHSQSIYGVSGEYSFGKGGFAQLGYVSGSGSNSNVASASIGFRF